MSPQLYKVFKTAISTGNDISAKIFEIGNIAYRKNDNWSFELPELTFMSTQDIAVGTNIYVQSVLDADNQVQFYIDKKTYIYERKMYSYRCPHIFMKLREIKTTEIPGGLDIGGATDWCDITPTLQEYNRYMGSTLLTKWNRQYYSCIFLLWIMIRKVTGKGIATLDASAIYNENSIYTLRYEVGGSYVDSPQQYKRLGIPAGNVFYMGMENSDQAGSDDYWIRRGLPSMLDLLQCICMATGIVINIFRVDYALSAFNLGDEPADAEIETQTVDTLEAYKDFKVTAKRLDGGTHDLIFGEYDEFGVLHRYTFGVDDPERTIGTYEAKVEVDEVQTDRRLNVQFPSFFRIYSIIGTPPASNANIFPIYNEEDDTDELKQLVDAYANYWGGHSTRTAYTGIAGAFDSYLPMVDYDITNKRVRKEKLG